MIRSEFTARERADVQAAIDKMLFFCRQSNRTRSTSDYLRIDQEYAGPEHEQRSAQ